MSNCVQAIARDCLAETLLRVEAAGIRTVFHVHDEIIAEAPTEYADMCLQRALEIMAEPIPWAPGLLLKGDGFTCQFYKKD